MRNFLFLILLSLFTSCTPEKSNRVHISGEFPTVADATAKMFIEKNGEKWRFSTPIKEGKFHIAVDSLEKGIYNVIIEWPRPFEKRYMSYRNKEGVAVRKYVPKVAKFISFSKQLYINPEQSQSYHIIPEKNITDEMINDYDSVSYLRTDLFRLKVVSEAKDTQLFERLDSVKKHHREYSVYLIFDSLYRSSSRPDKIAHDFISLAYKINFKKNYESMLRTRREIIKNDLDNPIAAWDLLDIGNDQLLAEIDEYEDILKKMAGRAKGSSYYKQAMLKLDGLKSPLAEGQVLLLPTGHTPDLEEINFNPSDYRYTLVEFWASWCGPCRVQNPDWNELLYNYKNKGFQILGVSLDISAANWTKAIEGDHLDDWLHVSDLGDGFKGSNALRYGIQAIPFNVLIDQEGRIVTKDIGPAKLNEFLMKMLTLSSVNEKI